MDSLAEPGRSYVEASANDRFAGYCVLCNRIVERTPEGECSAGHPTEAVWGAIRLGLDETAPVLPKFNMAAFVMPPIWGPAHGAWAGFFVLPIWLFADNVFVTAFGGSAIRVIGAILVGLFTLLFQCWFATRANGLAFRRVCERVSVADFARRQRVWALACVPLAAALIGWTIYFHVVIEPLPIF